MPFFLFKLALLITLIFSATNLVFRALASTQPKNPALRGFTEGCEDKPQPCWYGIVPGNTTVEMAQRLMESQPFQFYDLENDSMYFLDQSNRTPTPDTCSNIQLSYDPDSFIISTIALTKCDQIVLGDLSLIGFSEKIIVGYMKLGEYFTAAKLRYEQVNNLSHRREWSPYTPVYSLDIGSSSLGMNKTIDMVGYPWHGFVFHWRYCQLEPKYQDCP